MKYYKVSERLQRQYDRTQNTLDQTASIFIALMH